MMTSTGLGRLAGKIALVTGASRGIGLATAELFLDEDASVALAARPSAHFDAACARLRERFDVLQLEVDVRDSVQCTAAVEATVARWGRVDILFNNAGSSFVARIDELTDEQWRLAFETSVAGQFWFAREVAKVMIRQHSGAIVNMASELAFQGQIGHATQSATKGASLAFTRSLAADLAPFGIRVNAVAPGRIDTDTLRKEYLLTPDPEAKRSADERAILARRFGRPEEVARAVLFLASDESSYTTGAALPVDGGTINCEPVGPHDRLSGWESGA
jgi:NAD(P)-dependent dehydrogenase (short-subunit alcohol dehydrogenase family)